MEEYPNNQREETPNIGAMTHSNPVGRRIIENQL